MTEGLLPIPPGWTPPEPLPVTSQDIASVLGEKIREAYYFFGLRRVKESHDLFEQANGNFAALYLLAWATKGQVLLAAGKKPLEVTLEIVREIPFVIPLKLRRRKGLPSNIFDISKEYEEVLARVKQWKKLRGTRKAKQLALMSVLPAVDWDTAGKLYRKDASEIARAYIAMKHNLPSGDTAKKQISLARQPAKFAEKIYKAIACDAGVKLVKSPKIAKTPTRFSQS
jgi:hypothetical protein